MYNSKIIGLGKYVPENIVTNSDLEEDFLWRLIIGKLFKNNLLI